jgi:TonB family protein
MRIQGKSPNHPLRAVVISLVLHGAFFAGVFLFGTRMTIRMVEHIQPQVVARISDSGASHAIRITLPASELAAHTRTPDAYADPSKKTILPMEVPPLKKSGGGSPKSPHHGDGSGGAVFGNGSDSEDVRPAFPVFSPHPPVTDRSLLPATAEKIVVDVDVDAAGQVVSERLIKGLGTKLDQIVLATVKTWRFQPAMVNGKAVPTEAELIFPFNLDYPIARS